MSWGSREALSDVREPLPVGRQWLFGPPRCPGVVRIPCRMFRSGLVALQCVWQLSGSYLGWPGVVVRPSRMSGSGQETLPDVQKWSNGTSGCPAVIWRTSRMSGSGWETLPDVWE